MSQDCFEDMLLNEILQPDYWYYERKRFIKRCQTLPKLYLTRKAELNKIQSEQDLLLKETVDLPFVETAVETPNVSGKMSILELIELLYFKEMISFF